MNLLLAQTAVDFIGSFCQISTLGNIPHTPSNVSEIDYKFNYDLLKSELNEYVSACRTNNKLGIADSIGDMLVVVIGLVFKHGMQHDFIENILLPICISNGTKVCHNREDAVASVKAYKVKGIETKYVEFAGVYAIFRLSDMKILKGVRFQEPEIKI